MKNIIEKIIRSVTPAEFKISAASQLTHTSDSPQFHKAPKYDYIDLIKSIDAELCHYDNINPENKCLFLRHDEDRELEYTIALAKHEHEHQIKSTYFLNHSENYFDYSTNFIEQCKKIIDYGHEIGIHSNALEEHLVSGESIENIITKPLEFFRKNGIRIQGVSSHGSKICLNNKLFNFEIWKEFESSNMAILKESNRFNGTLNFDRLPLSNFDLKYDASILESECYISDSSGRLWGAFKIGLDYADKINDLIEVAEILRGSTVIKYNIKDIIQICNSSLKTGLIHILFHPVWWLRKKDIAH